MTTPLLNAITAFAVAIGRENVSLGGAAIELPMQAWVQLLDESHPGYLVAEDALCIVLATPNGDVTVRRKERP